MSDSANDKALALVQECLREVVGDKADTVTADMHLVKDGIIDSLDSMSLIFEIEKRTGTKLVEITDEFTDFRVETLVGIVARYL